MRRTLAVLLVLAITLPMVITACVLIRFHMDRDRIIREVCVQRARPIEQNCCKGMCHLRKQLKEQDGEERGPRSLPRIELREEPAITDDTVDQVPVLPACARTFGPEAAFGFAAGYRSITEPVPWC